MQILIAGGGKIGAYLADTFAKRGHTVSLIEKKENIARSLAENLDNVLVVAGDACEPEILEEAGVQKAQVLVAVTGDDEDNLIICQVAKETFGTVRTISRVNNPKNEETFIKLGLDAVSSTSVISKLIEEEATVGDIITLLTLKKGQITIVEVTITPASPMVNLYIKEINLPDESIIATILRLGKTIFPKGHIQLLSGDEVVILTIPQKENEIKNLFLGKTK